MENSLSVLSYSEDGGLPTNEKLRVILVLSADDLDTLPVILPQGGSLEKREPVNLSVWVGACCGTPTDSLCV